MEVKGNFINYGSYVDVHDNEVVNLTIDKGKVKVDKAELTSTTTAADADKEEESHETGEPEPCEAETFADRVKAIMRKAAEKNGQRIESRAREGGREERAADRESRARKCGYIYISYRRRRLLQGDGRHGEHARREAEGIPGRHDAERAGDEGMLLHRTGDQPTGHQRLAAADGRHVLRL